MERRLAIVAGVAIVVAGTLLHFVYGLSGHNALAGMVSPVNEAVWEHTELLVVPVVVAGAVEAVLLHDVRRVAWAALGEAILGGWPSSPSFTPTLGALGTGPTLWARSTSFVLVVAGGQWPHLRVMLQADHCPAGGGSVPGLYLLVLSCTSPWMGSGAVVAAGVACCRGHGVAGFGQYRARSAAHEQEAPPASAFTAATQYFRPR